MRYDKVVIRGLDDNRMLRIRKMGKWEVLVDLDNDNYYSNNIMVCDDFHCYYMDENKLWDNFFPVPKQVRDYVEEIAINLIKEPIGVVTMGLKGIEIIDIDDVEEKITIRDRYNNRIDISKLKIYSNRKGMYFNWGSNRIYLSDVERL